MSKNQPDTNKQQGSEKKTTYVSPPNHARQPPGSLRPISYAERPPGPPYGYPGQWQQQLPTQHFPVPFQQQSPTQGTGSFLDKLPIKDIKGFVDRMGGIEGIMNMVTKVNSMMKTFQQMAPMLKLLFGSFTGKAATTGAKSTQRKKGRSARTKRRSQYQRSGSSKGRQYARHSTSHRSRSGHHKHRKSSKSSVTKRG